MGQETILTVRFVDLAGEKRELSLGAGESLRIGRLDENEICIVGTNVSRFHAILSTSRHGTILSDLGSLNGTLVNGRRITSPLGVQAGDVIEIGNTKIEVAGVFGTMAGEEEATLETEAFGMQAVVVTVLLADICHYTKMSEVLPMQEVTAMLQRSFDEVSAVVSEFGGEVDKYIGDCMMALFSGSREEEQQLALRAAEAATVMEQRLNELAQSGAWPYQEKHPWQMRFALNSGEALFGAIGSRESRDFTVLGDTVNVVFRLENLAGKLDKHFILSESTARLISDHYALTSLGEVEVEGRKAKIEVFTKQGE